MKTIKPGNLERTPPQAIVRWVEPSSLLKNSSSAWNFAISGAKTARKQGKRAVLPRKARLWASAKAVIFFFQQTARYNRNSPVLRMRLETPALSRASSQA